MLEIWKVFIEALPTIGGFAGVLSAAYCAVILARTRAKKKIDDERIVEMEAALKIMQKSLNTMKEALDVEKSIVNSLKKEVERLYTRIDEYQKDIDRKDGIIKQMEKLNKAV